MMRLASFTAILAAPFALSSCADPAPLYVDQAWVQLNANPDAPSAGYFTVHGGPESVALRDVRTEGALRIEMHESRMQDGVMTMAPIPSVDVPAQTKLAFAPGGKHLMIYGINPAVVKEGKMSLMFIFSNGDRLPVDAAIKAVGAGSAPMNGMDHAH